MVVEVFDDVVVFVLVDFEDDGFDGGVAFDEDACLGGGLGRFRKNGEVRGEGGEVGGGEGGKVGWREGTFDGFGHDGWVG